MGIFGRLFSLAKGKANDTVDSLEAKNLETVVNQATREAEQDLQKNIKSSAAAAAECIRLENQLKELQRSSKDWGKKAEMAVDADDDELATAALEKQAEVDNQIASLKPTVDAARQTKKKLEQAVDRMKREISKKKQQAKTMVARHNAAEAQKKLNQAAAGIGESGNAFAKLERLEGVVSQGEAEAQAYGDMGADPDADLEDRFAKLGSTSAADRLAALKAKKAKS